MRIIEHYPTAGLRHDAAILLDRDGTLIADVPTYVRTPDDVVLVPGLAQAVRALHELDVPVAVVSNQAGVARGLLSEENALAVHRFAIDALGAIGLRVHLSLLCFHADEDRCRCRKPLPGLLLEASHRFGVPASATYMIGDAERDIGAAVAAHMIPMLVLTGHGHEAEHALPSDVVVTEDVAAALEVVCNRISRMRQESAAGD